ncbi:NADH:ubiquinone oxidoreductase, NDUFS6/13 kDa subunit [Plasmopara halstedii]|uniref:NADH:ubiquinone oxidoreductase, NDUFS6/13 kDa subunit n=1 Tax=Plasmopara halstedii TaxID=4781 RepID=A0A0P1AD53_PLAHL|nr:NADH:ubiquinone oxidoreductase, NDUFS6/13 kDa subunit [Plasmopara halstedii]CEG38454.1 NADH:ubiquinone oxidoreductase, NDUFS6/13 kDa subunit [Plasmopara halstedii]|eukprot:XP_024574823.1 NADH:ubiquinone oxidoreductase, NDUFS6/13 kDa subunit [Plasmopara halstedii]
MLRRSSQCLVSAARTCAPRVAQSFTAGIRLQKARFSTIYDYQTPFEDINRHRSDAEQRIAQVPIVELASNVAVCDGGGGALGHPVEYIQLDTREHNTPQTCKYCGIRFKMKEGYHGSH